MSYIFLKIKFKHSFLYKWIENFYLYIDFFNVSHMVK